MENRIVLDLFSGAGGLSLGFKMAGFNIAFAVELKKNYFETYKYNNPDCFCLNEDITASNLEKIDFFNERKNKVVAVIGGPPCQGFSTVGDRKLKDPRNSLIYYFVKWVKHFRPLFYVMENVPGILSMAKGHIVEEIKHMYQTIGYSCEVETLLSADLGVPQLRERVFFIGSLDKESIISDIFNKLKQESTEDKQDKNDGKNGHLTVKTALSDIIDLKPFSTTDFNNSALNYPSAPKTDYQEYLRKNSENVFDHVAPNHSALVKDRISHINQGENHASLPKAYQLKGGYPNIYGRLHMDKPADTITGNCGCVSAPGRFIHPIQDRAISVREAARLQSFPDNYRFFGSLSEMYKQVGNAVPPLMAYSLAKVIYKSFML